jgi:hypothetical protein
MGTRLDAFLSEEPKDPSCDANVPDAPGEVNGEDE